jgi:hypothetical protein
VRFVPFGNFLLASSAMNIPLRYAQALAALESKLVIVSGKDH